MNDKLKDIIISIVFILFISIIFLLNIFKSDTLISTSERRKLARFPKVSVKRLFNGEFFDNFDTYSMDQFIFREDFRKIKTLFEINIFNKKDMNNIYLYDGYLIKQEYPLNVNSLNNAGRKINNIIDLYLTDQNRVFLSIIPDKNYFVNNDNLKFDYDQLVNIMKNNIDATYIDLFDILKLEDYYYTDTHWKHENLIKVANKIGKSLGNDLISNAKYKKEKVSNFYGVLNGQLKLDTKKDYIYVLKNEVLDNAKVFNYEKNEYLDIYDFSLLNSFDKYDIYLSGATPLLYIENSACKNNKELIIFRDSYGSSLIPLLVNGYRKITVVDIRYISSYYLSDLVDFKNSDVLFLYSVLLLNSSGALK